MLSTRNSNNYPELIMIGVDHELSSRYELHISHCLVFYFLHKPYGINSGLEFLQELGTIHSGVLNLTTFLGLSVFYLLQKFFFIILHNLDFLPIFHQLLYSSFQKYAQSSVNLVLSSCIPSLLESIIVSAFPIFIII